MKPSHLNRHDLYFLSPTSMSGERINRSYVTTSHLTEHGCGGLRTDGNCALESALAAWIDLT
eukprot:822958-Amphidinium_carterae.1